MLKILVLAAAALVSSAPKPVTGNAVAHLEAVGGAVNFTAEQIPVTGEVEVKDGVASGWFYADLTSAKTGNGTRDEHVHKDYMKTKAHPKAKLKLVPFKLGQGDVPFDAELTIQGVTKPVKGVASVDGNKFKAKVIWKVSDYPTIGAPKIPGLTGVLLRDEVEVEVTGELKG